MKRVVIISAVSLLLLLPAALKAQTVPFVNLGYNAEQMAMGGTNATYNTAAAFSDKSYADISWFNWQPKGANSTMLGVDAGIKAGSNLAILVDGKYNAFPEFQGYDINGNPSGSIKSSQMYAALGASYAITENFGFALKAKFIQDNLTNDAKGSAVCADISFGYHKDGLDVALTTANIGSKLKYGSAAHNLPMTVKAGVAKKFDASENSSIKLAADAGYIVTAKSLTAGVGAEFCLANIFDIRAGYHLGTNGEPSFASVGLGLDVSVLRISAAYLIGPKEAGNTIAASLGFAF